GANWHGAAMAADGAAADGAAADGMAAIAANGASKPTSPIALALAKSRTRLREMTERSRPSKAAVPKKSNNAMVIPPSFVLGEASSRRNSDRSVVPRSNSYRSVVRRSAVTPDQRLNR